MKEKKYLTLALLLNYIFLFQIIGFGVLIIILIFKWDVLYLKILLSNLVATIVNLIIYWLSFYEKKH